MPPGQTPLAVGTLLRERYLVRGVLGAGNAGTVYQVKDQQSKSLKYNLFALKEITGLDRQARYQFTYNGAALRQIQHPALPRIYQVFNDDKRDCIYLVMDYVEGANMEVLRLQKPAGRLTWSELQTLFEPIVGALTYLHRQEKPLFHGDIKPTNVIQSITGKVLLVDHGYALVATPELLRQSVSTVYLNYRAPEYFAGKIAEASDIYSLSATLYALLTGQAPFDAQTRLRRVEKKKPDPLLLASEVVTSLPRQIAEGLQRGLSLDPGGRFASVRLLWQALKAVSGEAHPSVAALPEMPVPIQVSDAEQTMSLFPPAGEVERGQNARLPRRHQEQDAFLPRVIIICALLVVLLGAGMWAWSLMHNPLPTSSPTHQRPLPIHSSTSLPPPSVYPDVRGTYTGTYGIVGTPLTNLSLAIQEDQLGAIHGTFTSAQQDGTFTGTIASSGSVQFTVVNASGNAILVFSGGLNGIPHPTDSMGGTFSKCVPDRGATCVEDAAPDSGGPWVLNYTSSVSIAPTAPWS